MPSASSLGAVLAGVAPEATVLAPVDEAPGVSTNDAAQWALAAIENLALIGDQMPVQGV